ncbi:MAG: hypothetical protein QOJ95_814 [Mycobacterium sp.]|jgi:hypothetical protein|nr:hypothetical protein [Mycobacterium sp.]
MRSVMEQSSGCYVESSRLSGSPRLATLVWLKSTPHQSNPRVVDKLALPKGPRG